MDINQLKKHNGELMMTTQVYGFVLMWLEKHVEKMNLDEFIHFIAAIKLSGLSDELKTSIKERRRVFPNLMPLDFGVLLNLTFDCIIENNLDDFKRLGYNLTHDQIKL
jgi:hypothetical protein